MSESVESMGRPELEVMEIPVDALIPDEMNPNRLSEHLLQALRKDIAERGFVQPIVVRPLPGKNQWQIIDGEHRWRAMRELGEKTVSCVVDDALPDEARMRMLTLNRLRGQFDGQRLAACLARLASVLDEDELRERLGMPPEEFKTVLEEAEVPDQDEALREAVERKGAEELQVIRFRLGPRNAKVVERAIEEMTTEFKATRAEALIKLLRTGLAEASA